MDQFIFWKVTVSDIISLSGLIVTIWIAKTVKINLTKSRFIREHFIHETSQLRDEYRRLFSQLYSGKLSAKVIKDRLKVLTLRIKSLEMFVHIYYKIQGDKLGDAHAKFQQFITAEDDFNNQYSKKTVNFSSEVKTKIFKYQKDISDAITHRIIDINSSKSNSKHKILQLKAHTASSSLE